MREAATIRPRPCDLHLLTLKVVSESRVTWATFMPILVFLGLSVLDRPDVRDRQTEIRQTASSLNPPPRGRRHNNTQDDIYSAVIMTTRSLREFTRFI